MTDQQANPTDITAILSSLPLLPENYTNVDRWRDFQAVLMSERGKRVLVQLIHICGTYLLAHEAGLPADATTSERTLMHEGARRAGRRIVEILLNQPMEPTHDDDRLST